jgi:hypothetical protein
MLSNGLNTISDYLFFECGLTSLNMPISVKTIGRSAFEGCGNLSSINLSPNITSIGDYAFKGCNLNKINVFISDYSSFCNNEVVRLIRNKINKPVVLIDNEEKEIKDYIIPNGVTSIGSSAFENCSGLTSITIPNSVTSIGSEAFRDCIGLTSMGIPNSISSIDNYAFSGCNNLTSVDIHSTNIGSWFRELSSIKTITIGDEVTSIGESAFSGCSGLSSVKIPNSVKTIGSYAFSGCRNLLSLTIGTGVTSIGYDAFYNTNLKKTIWLTNTPPSGYSGARGAVNYVANEQYNNLSNTIVYQFISSLFEVDGIYYVPVSPSERTCDAIDCTYDVTAANTTINSTVSYKGINMKVLNIQPYLFYKNEFLENLVSYNEGEIGQYALSECNNLKKVTLGQKISTIGDYAFQNCSSLPNIIIPDSVKVLGESSFNGCELIERILIPKTLTKISNYAFYACTGLKEFIIEDRTDELTLGSNGYSPLFSDCPLDYVYIGGNINYNTQSKSGYSPFYRNTSLRNVVITDKETEISANEFYGCTNLQNFVVGDGVESFGDWAFSGCSSLKKLSFGTKLKTIGKEVFSDCTAVTEIVSKAVVPPVCDNQALDDINKWDCTLFVPTGSLASYQAADQWKEFFFMKEGTGTGIAHVSVNNPHVKSENGEIIITGVDDGTNIDVYSTNGQMVCTAIACGNSISLPVEIRKGEIAIVKIGEKSVKIMVK